MKKYLIVDDCEDNLNLHKMYLEKAGITNFKLLSRANAELTEELLNGDYTHLVIDRQMPGVEGDDFLVDFLDHHKTNVDITLFSAYIPKKTYTKLEGFDVTFNSKDYESLYTGV